MRGTAGEPSPLVIPVRSLSKLSNVAPMYKHHPELGSLPDDIVLWRYMDFTKFVSFRARLVC